MNTHVSDFEDALIIVESDLVRIHCSHQPSQYLISFIGFTMQRYLCPGLCVCTSTIYIA